MNVRTHGRLLADVPRVIALASIAVAWPLYPPGTPIVFAILLAVLLVIRQLDVAWQFDLAFGVLVLVAMWAAVADWYQALPWLDWVTHCVSTGAIAAAARLVLARVRALPVVTTPGYGRSAVLISTTAVGVTLAVLWEFYEWFATAVGLPAPRTGYADTIADLAMGTVGSALAGCAILLSAARDRSDLAAAQRDDDADVPATPGNGS